MCLEDSPFPTLPVLRALSSAHSLVAAVRMGRTGTVAETAVRSAPTLFSPLSWAPISSSPDSGFLS